MDGWNAADDADARADRADEAVRAAVAGELRLHDAGVRACADAVGELLDPEFVEFGASGRRWDAESILPVTGSGEVTAGEPIEVAEMSGVLLAPGVVHLTYVSGHRGRRARRSSLWRLTPAGWRLYFHQGTVTPDTA